MNRADFIKQAFRSMIGLVMIGGTAMLVSKGKIAKRSECTANYLCGKCRELDGCYLAKAQKFRSNGKG